MTDAPGRPGASRSAGTPTTTRSPSGRTAPSSVAATGTLRRATKSSVAPDADAEVRRITLRNEGPRVRTLDVTSYAEVALDQRRADQAHPAFAKLFLETEYLSAPPALLCRRRPRARDQQPIWALHVLSRPEEAPGVTVGDVEYKTDRARFLGRGRSAARPAALDAGSVLSGTVGPVLDPVLSLRCRVRLDPGTSTVLAFGTAIATDRDQAATLAGRLGDPAEVARIFGEAGIHDAAALTALAITAEDAARFRRLAAHVVFTGTALRSRESVAANRLGQSALWPHAISGDLPIVLARLASLDELALAGELLRAHAYLHRCGVVADLVLLNVGGPVDGLHERLEELVARGPVGELTDKPGGVFLRAAEAMSAEDVTLLEAAARAILRGSDGSLAAQLARAPAPVTLPAAFIASGGPATPRESHPPVAVDRLLFGNGLGGFTPDAQEYIVTVRGHERPPAPWSNVLANETFGCLITEAGAGYTWAGNSADEPPDSVEQRPGLRSAGRGALSPRRGDRRVLVARTGPVRRRDDHCGAARPGLHPLQPDQPWSATRSCSCSSRQTTPSSWSDCAQSTAAAVPGGCLRPSMPSGCWACCGNRRRSRSSAPSTTESGALFARNAWTGDFAGRIAFADVARRPRSFTADRAEFLGRNGTLAAPAALGRARLADRAGERLRSLRGADDRRSSLPAGEEDEVVFMLGQAESVDEARRLVQPLPARRDARSRRSRTCARNGTASSALSRCGRRIPRWMRCSIAGCSTRRSPAGCGAGRRSTSPAGRTASATSCRM